MSHHSPKSLGSSILDDAFSEDLARAKELLHDEHLKLGPTGKYPNGKLCDHDQGEFQYAVAADKRNRVVIVDFGKPVASIGFTIETANAFIELLKDKVFELRGTV